MDDAPRPTVRGVRCSSGRRRGFRGRCGFARRAARVSPTVSGVITGELKSRIDRIWDAFWSGGISNPIEVIEQITYLLFIRRLDDRQVLAERKARVTRGPIEDPVFLPGQEHLRWRELRNRAPEGMYRTKI